VGAVSAKALRHTRSFFALRLNTNLRKGSFDAVAFGHDIAPPSLLSVKRHHTVRKRIAMDIIYRVSQAVQLISINVNPTANPYVYPQYRSNREGRAMPTRTLCPKCHGQRTCSCPACSGSGGRAFAGVIIGICEHCHGSGRCRCDVCGGAAEVEPETLQRLTAEQHLPR
jgi:hypothetical protein